MLNVSPLWLPATQADELQIISYAQVFSGIGGTLLGTFPLVPGSGTVAASSTNAVRRQLSTAMLVAYLPKGTYTDPGVGSGTYSGAIGPDGAPVPLTYLDTMFPDGNEIVIWKGFLYTPQVALTYGIPAYDNPLIYDNPLAYDPAAVVGYPRTTNVGVPLPFGGYGEAVPLGRFLMEQVDIQDGYSGPGSIDIQVSGSDRGATIARASLTVPYVTNGTASLDVQIMSLLNSLPINGGSKLLTNFNPGNGYGDFTTFPVPAAQSLSIGDDPWATMQTMCSGCGYELFFDVYGVLNLRPIPNPVLSAPVAYFNEGLGCTVSKLKRSLINTDVPNVIIMVSQGSTINPPLQAIWFDNDPNSPTYYGPSYPGSGPQGTYPTTTTNLTNNVATTQAALNAAVSSAGIAVKGLFSSVLMDIIANPALEVEDVVELTRTRAGIPSGTLYVIGSMSVPIDYATEEEYTMRGVFV